MRKLLDLQEGAARRSWDGGWGISLPEKTGALGLGLLSSTPYPTGRPTFLFLLLKVPSPPSRLPSLTNPSLWASLQTVTVAGEEAPVWLKWVGVEGLLYVLPRHAKCGSQDWGHLRASGRVS